MMLDQREVAGRVRDAIIALVGMERRKLRPGSLVARLAELTGLTQLDIRSGLASLRRDAWLSGVDTQGLPFGMVEVTGDIPSTPADPLVTNWRTALERAGASVVDTNSLLSVASSCIGLSQEDMERLGRGLLELRARQAEVAGQPAFVVSAKFLCGASKILSGKHTRALRKFGINVDLFTESANYVVTAGPPNPESVVLIENPTSFELAAACSAVDRVAFLATFGYGLSRSGEAFGQQLASIVTVPASLVPLVRAGQPPAPHLLLRHRNITFWGDLDHEGLRIFLRLKQTIPQLELSALYRPMATRLYRDGGHPYAAITGKDGQIPLSRDESASSAAIGRLSGCCATAALDQETLDVEDIGMLAGLPLGNLERIGE